MNRAIMPIALCAALLLNSCVPGIDQSGLSKPGLFSKAVPLFSYIDENLPSRSYSCADFAKNFESDFPVSVSVLYQNVGGGSPYTTSDKDTIRAVFKALENISATGEGGPSHTDDCLSYYFTMADSSEIKFEFQMGCFIGHNENLISLSGFEALPAALDYPPGWEEPIETRPLYANGQMGFEVELFEGWEAKRAGPGAVEIIPPEKLKAETTTNLIIELIKGRTAKDASQEAKAQARFGAVVERDQPTSYLYISGPYTGVRLEWEKPGEAGTVLWTLTQFIDDGEGGCYLVYFTTTHDARYDSRITWFGAYAESIIYTFRLPKYEKEREGSPQ